MSLAGAPADPPYSSRTQKAIVKSLSNARTLANMIQPLAWHDLAQSWIHLNFKIDK